MALTDYTMTFYTQRRTVKDVVKWSDLFETWDKNTTTIDKPKPIHVIGVTVTLVFLCGFRNIDGVRCAIFKSRKDGKHYGQNVVFTNNQRNKPCKITA